jgi:flagellar FliL protein
MSAAAVAEAAPPAPKGKKKLIIIILAAVLVLVLGGGGAALMLSKKKAAEEAELDAEEGQAPEAKATAKFDPKAVPVFVPLDPFTVNLADRDAERYAQIGITLELDDAKTGDMLKLYMPAIRNNILLAIADRTAADLLDREGKTRLAERVKREVSRAIGFEVGNGEPAAPAAAPADDEGDEPKPKKKPKKATKAAEPALPVKAVHFSNFIIQ